MRFKIRPVDPFVFEDELIELHNLTFGDDCPRPDFILGFWWIVTDVSQRQVGFCGLKASDAIPNAGYLERAGVLPCARGYGLQRRMIRVREAKARRLGWKLLRTDTTENVQSSNNLIRSGFTLFEPHYKWAFAHSLYWQKSL